MTRIVSGAWRGRRLGVPADPRVRPTAERVREAWLNILGPELRDATVLDLYAGSGALGLEALSRGARTATFVEINPPSLATLRANIDAMNCSREATVRRADALRFIGTLAANAFDIALADPPFTTDAAPRVAEQWTRVPFASVLAVEHHPRTQMPAGETRRWGDVSVTFYRA